MRRGDAKISNQQQQGNKSEIGSRNKGQEGKRFEKDIRNSIPDDVFCYRLKDDGMRFAGVCNPCDFIIYRYPFIYLWELKSHKGKSIPFSVIREQQLKKLVEIEQRGISTGFLLNFRDLGETYWVPAKKVQGIWEKGVKRSISVEWCRIEGIRVEQILKRTRYNYNILKLLKDLFKKS